MIPKDFEFLDIFIESKWGYFVIYIYVLKLMESKVKEDINFKYVQYHELRKGLQKVETKFLMLVIDYTGPIIDYMEW